MFYHATSGNDNFLSPIRRCDRMFAAMNFVWRMLFGSILVNLWQSRSPLAGRHARFPPCRISPLFLGS